MRLVFTGPLLAAAITAFGCAASAQAPDSVHYLSSADLAAQVRVLKDGLAVSVLPTAPGVLVLLGRRDRDGEVEVHAKRNDQIFVREGHATILVGGQVEGGHAVGPDEMRGGRIVGARTYDVSAGDSLWIPAGAPHQMLVPPGASFSYVTVKL